MPLSLPEIIIQELKLSVDLADVQEWQPVNGLITLNAPGISVGVGKERYSEYDRLYDDCIAKIGITVWEKDADPAEGERKVRERAHAARMALLKNETLEGMVDNVFINEIEYLTEDAGSGLLLHVASMDVEVNYMAERVIREIMTEIETINTDTGSL